MKTIEFTPTICKKTAENENPAYEGTVTLIVPSASEKLELLEEIGIEVDDSGDVKATKSGLATSAKMIKASERFYKAVNIKRTCDQSELKSFDDINYEPECLGAMIEIANLICSGGVKVSKN